MKDAGHDETNKVLDEIEKRIAKEYKQAEKEVTVKLGEYLRKFEIKDELKRRALENGLITEDEYKQWRIGQVMIGKRWAEMRDTLAQDFTNASQIAKSIAFDHMPEVYAINHNYGTFQVEKASLVDTSYTLYDRQALEELVKNGDKFIPAPGRKVTRAINEGKQLAWDRKQVQSVMMQGLLQGESIPKLATRLANAVGESDRKAAVRNARTMTTGVQNAGRIASYDRANKMGIETKKQWLAALDSRTRHWHAALDGETVDNDEPFENEFGKIMYPGDPSADPANIYNCRCTLIASIKGFERDVSDMNLRRDEKLGDMSYEEWKAGKYEQTSDNILKQDEIAETMQWVYGAEYAKYKNLSSVESEVINQTSFVAASTIEEAQSYAQQFIETNFMDRTFKGNADFKGISLEHANEINKALTNVYGAFPNMKKISGIKVVSPTSAAGKKAFKDGADALFAYDPIQHGIYVNGNVLKNADTLDKYIKESEEAWNIVKNNLDTLKGSQRDLAERYLNAGRSLVDGETVEGLFTHEMGHHVEWTMLDAKTNNSIGSNMSEYASNISGYATASKSEYLAESFTAYMKGERDTLDPQFVGYLDSKNIIANLGNDGIIKVKDTLIGRSLGAKAKNYDVEDPATGEIFNFVEGTKIQNSEIFAGYTTKKPLKEEVTHGLTEIYGGTESKWQHCKGNGVIDVYGEETRAEVHWFQEESVGKVKFKVKEWLE